MAWTKQLIQVDRETESTRATAVVLFSDGSKYKFLETFDLKGHTATSFRATVESRRKQLEDSYSFIDTIDPKVFDLTVDLIVVTPEQQAEKDFLVLFNDWDTKKREFDAATTGKVPTKLTQQDVDSALSAWKAQYIEPYWKFIAGRV